MPYRFAIIGCGNISRRHAAAIQQFGTLVAASDPDPAKLMGFAGEFNAAPFLSVSQMLSTARADIVCICSPSGLHASHAIEALNARCHVLCEKPMAITLHQAAEMIETAGRLGKKLFVVKQNRYNLPVAAVKDLLLQGKLGKIHSFQLNCLWNRNNIYYQNTWRGTAANDGGTLYTQFSHFIDLLYWYLGDVDSVTGWRANFLHQGIIEFEDTGCAAIKMRNGAMGTLNWTINAHERNMEGSITLMGEKGSIKIGGEYLDRIEYFSVENEDAAQWMQKRSADKLNRHEEVYRAMINSLHTPTSSVVEAEEALQSLKVIEQIYKGCPLIETTSNQ